MYSKIAVYHSWRSKSNKGSSKDIPLRLVRVCQVVSRDRACGELGCELDALDAGEERRRAHRRGLRRLAEDPGTVGRRDSSGSEGMLKIIARERGKP
jgi:hypothetical protein